MQQFIFIYKIEIFYICKPALLIIFMITNLVSTRFNTDTWRENQENRTRRGIVCFYAAPREMTSKILFNSMVFVVEMNNSINKIEGIGLIHNKPTYDKYYKMYTEENYNRYFYFGKYYLSRNQLMEYNETLVEIFDFILFKGKSHLKRGTGFTQIPEKLISNEICRNRDLKKEIINAFIYYHKNIHTNKAQIEN
jgi:hypothetical protein